MQMIELKYYIDLLPRCNILTDNDLIQNGFIFGYAQGLKAAKAQMKGGVA